MNISQIPNLEFANCRLESWSGKTTFSERPIPKNFKINFYLKKDRKIWRTSFHIKISDLGTPRLLSVNTFGCGEWPISFIERAKKHELFTDEEKRLFKLSSDGQAMMADPESVERWQLKFVEQYRFQLFELALLIAMQDSFYSPKDVSLNAREIRELQKQIGKKIRQRITPDFLREVADLYTRAGSNGENPIPAIMEVYKCSHRRAQEYATMARNLKLLPATERRKVTVNEARARRGNK